ncbi:MAG: hypothetical protein U0271_20190 [Polyangiaceae bacterium]
MTVLELSSEEVLLTALSTGLVPADVASQPLTFARHDKAFLIDATSLDTQLVGRLVKLGATRKRGALDPSIAREAPFWAAAIAPHEVAAPDLSVVLFVVPEPESALDLAAELIALGGARVELSTAGKVCLVRAAEPSLFVTWRVLDQRDRSPTRAFVPAARGREDAWIEAGCAHPLFAAVRPTPPAITLMHASGAVELLAPEPFVRALDHIDFRLAPLPDAERFERVVQLPRRTINLRLVRAVRRAAPTLWLLRSHGERALDLLIRDAPESLVASLDFVALDRDDPNAAGHVFSKGEKVGPQGMAGKSPVILLRAPPSGREPALVDAEEFAAIPELGDVYVPAASTVHPPLSADRLRLVAGGPDDLLRWLEPHQNGVVVRTVAKTAFQPLARWVEIVAARADLTPWLANVSIEPPPFPIVARPREPDPDDEPLSKRRGTRRARPEREAHEGAPDTDRSAPPEPEPAPTIEVEPAPEARGRRRNLVGGRDGPSSATAGDARTLEALEASAADSPDPLASLDTWLALGRAYATAGRTHDAAACFARVVCDAQGELANTAAAAWTELRESPQREAGLLIAAGIFGDRRALRGTTAATLVTALDTAGDGLLDVRAAWLAREAQARLASHDVLGLARARDRALARLERGLSIGRDFPRFVRLAGARGLGERARALESALTMFERTKRPKSPLEADPTRTLAYVRLVVACSLARLGEAARATALGEAPPFAKDDAVHTWLTSALRVRLEQALEGASDHTPLGAELAAAYGALGRLDRYKVDRVRQASRILEPDPTSAPFTTFGENRSDELAALVAKLAAATLPSEAAAVLEGALANLEALPPPQRAERVRAAALALLHAPRSVATARARAVTDAARALPSDQRGRALAVAAEIASALDEDEAAAIAVDGLLELCESGEPGTTGAVARELSRLASVIARAGRAEVVVARLGAVIDRVAREGPRAIEGWLALVSAVVALGNDAPAAAAVKSALTAAEAVGIPLAERIRITRGAASIAATVGDFASVTAASGLWKSATDSYNTNTHLCLSAVEIADAIAWSLAPRGASDRARSLAEDDERTVRRRIFEREAAFTAEAARGR